MYGHKLYETDKMDNVWRIGERLLIRAGRYKGRNGSVVRRSNRMVAVNVDGIGFRKLRQSSCTLDYDSWYHNLMNRNLMNRNHYLMNQIRFDNGAAIEEMASDYDSEQTVEIPDYLVENYHSAE